MVTAPSDPSRTLDQLNQFVAEQETFLNGPLTGIGNQDGNTIIVIDEFDPNGKPTPAAKVTTGTIPAGGKQIGKGKVYIAGKLTDATAYRPAAA